MSNVDVIREFWRVWSEEGLRAVLSRYDDFFTEDLEWRPPVSEVAGVGYVGRKGFEQYVADLEETLSEIQGDLEEVTEIAPDVVRSRVQMHGEGTSSGAVIDAPVISITRFRDGRACWGWATYDHAAAERVTEALARGEKVSV